MIKASDATTWSSQQNNTIEIEFDNEGGNTPQITVKHHKGKAANAPAKAGQNGPAAPKPKTQ